MKYKRGDYVCLVSGYCARVLASRGNDEEVEYLIAGPTGTKHGSFWAKPSEMTRTEDSVRNWELYDNAD